MVTADGLAPILLMALLNVLTITTGQELGLPEYVVSECYGDIFNFDCGPGNKIRINRDFFGYSSNRRCRYMREDCIISNPKSNSLIHRFCTGHRVCTYYMVERRGCGGFFSNYQQVEYQCIPDSSVTDVCSHTEYEAESTYIASPNFPENYPPNLQCHCVVTAADEDTKVQMEIVYLAIKYTHPCRDWLGIGRRRTCGTTVDLFQGTSIPIEFHSDGDDSHSGFWLHFQASKKGGKLIVRCGNATSAKDSQKLSSHDDTSHTPQPEIPSTRARTITRTPEPPPEVTTPVLLLKVNDSSVSRGKSKYPNAIPGTGGHGPNGPDPSNDVNNRFLMTPAPPISTWRPITYRSSNVSTDSVRQSTPVSPAAGRNAVTSDVAHTERDIKIPRASNTQFPATSHTTTTSSSSNAVSSTNDPNSLVNIKMDDTETFGGFSGSRSSNSPGTPRSKSFVIQGGGVTSPGGLHPTTPPPLHPAGDFKDSINPDQSSPPERATDPGSTSDGGNSLNSPPEDQEIYDLSNPPDDDYNLGTNTMVNTGTSEEYSDYPDPRDALYDSAHDLRGQGGFVNLDTSDYGRDSVFELEEVDRDVIDFNETLEDFPTTKVPVSNDYEEEEGIITMGLIILCACIGVGILLVCLVLVMVYCRRKRTCNEQTQTQGISKHSTSTSIGDMDGDSGQGLLVASQNGSQSGLVLDVDALYAKPNKADKSLQIDVEGDYDDVIPCHHSVILLESDSDSSSLYCTPYMDDNNKGVQVTARVKKRRMQGPPTKPKPKPKPLPKRRILELEQKFSGGASDDSTRPISAISSDSSETDAAGRSLCRITDSDLDDFSCSEAEMETARDKSLASMSELAEVTIVPENACDGLEDVLGADWDRRSGISI